MTRDLTERQKRFQRDPKQRRLIIASIIVGVMVVQHSIISKLCMTLSECEIQRETKRKGKKKRGKEKCGLRGNKEGKKN